MTQTIETSIRDASRDGCSGCLVCGAPLASTRARYCSRAHQQRAFRLRHQTSYPDLQRLRHDRSAALEILAQALQVRVAGLVAETESALLMGA